MQLGLCLSRCSYRAVGCASTAVDALIFVNYVRSAFGNCLYRAAVCASSASDAFFRNLICHNISSFLRNNIYKRSIALRISFVNTNNAC